ncbi:ribonuclease HII [Nanobdella aerobiophila]|uniref:Ribonuclease HII n=1 Tax=Nanobdella aerobiophila TaxID=2586965 RepID=A0A915SKL5_9ARCH|nr:ribonuclease HII [Nanobdella aerobiophila]BBL45421.1 ribonuclease HII [Nanobdella aerobiophila]
MIVLGIDEAGRGPVIGPMVIAGYSIDERYIDDLKNTGVKDSKLLSRLEREKIYNQIISLPTNNYKYNIIDQKIIDKYVEKGRLNYLEFENMVNIINYIDPDKVIIDSPLVDTKKVIEYIKNNINKDINIIAENKADRKYPIVSAASIIAKVNRDLEIDKIKKTLNMDFGSGYPSDPRTIQSIRNNYDELKYYLRHSWSTVKKIKEERQRNIHDFFKK